ncbi:cytochrome d ubiquinol oxidase subunit II [Gordonia sp. (in: high G+C Gram-positive bacteria)]|uniref:cytochrome d ubiquinol oxidase subunit II n=1 Tax=Gordonia sp. (in: high G+C Gram-positive bacteria) TaxID=84139 RepID=UPI0039E47A0F
MGLPEFWFILIGVLFTGYFVLEGFDFGVGMLMGILGRGDEKKRRAVLNTIGPVWDGNEVWLLTAGGAMFAAFGGWYATMFTAFYIPLLIILVALIVRVCAIEWRGKINDPKWRQVWDWCIAIGSWIPALLWGVAFANVVRGLPINEKAQFTGTFWGLLNPYALLGGVTTLLAFLTHGAVFLSLKTGGNLRKESMALAARLSIAMTVVATAFLLWTQLAHGKGWTWVSVLIAAVSAIATVVLTQLKREGWAFAATSIAIIMTIVTLFGCLYPAVLPSTTDPANSLTIANTSSSHYTLVVMTWAAVLITPLVLLYQGWSYWVFRKRISASAIPAPTGLASLRG